MEHDVLLNIVCLAYNQKDYIKDCLDGFVMQKTDFRFNAIVHDDASTDGTADIIREYAEKYPDIIIPVYEEVNQFKTGHIYDKVFPLINGKYIAQCEGDDYWIDPLKLQKQVDYLELHPDCVVSCHRYYIRQEPQKDLTLQPNIYFDSEEGNNKNSFRFDRNYVFQVDGVLHNLCLIFRTKELPGLIKFAVDGKYAMFRDLHIFYYLMSCGSGVCHSFVGGVYRQNNGGIYCSMSMREQYFTNFYICLQLAQRTHNWQMYKIAIKHLLHGITGKQRLIPTWLKSVFT